MNKFQVTILRYTDEQFKALEKKSRVEVIRIPSDVRDKLQMFIGNTDNIDVIYFKFLEVSTGCVRTFTEIGKPSNNSEISTGESSSSGSDTSDDKEISKIPKLDRIYEVETHVFCIDSMKFLEKIANIRKEQEEKGKEDSEN